MRNMHRYRRTDETTNRSETTDVQILAETPPTFLHTNIRFGFPDLCERAS